MGRDEFIRTDYAPGKIRRNITDSYHFTEKNQTSKREYSGARVQNEPLAPSFEHEEEENREEEIRERNQKMRMNAPYLPDRIFDALPELLKPEFSYTELIEALNSEGISRSSAKRCRQRLLEMKIIVQQGDSYRFVNRQWRGKFEKYAREWV